MAADVKFFTNRREVEIGDFHSLKSRGGERRVKANIRIPMSNRATSGIPDWILDGYQFVVRDESLYDKSSCKGVKFEGMSMAFFTSDAIKRKMQGVGGLNGCTMDRFVIERVGDAEKAQVYLNFIIYAPCGRDIIGWFYDYQGATIFAEFDTTQASLVYDGESGREEESTDVSGEAVLVFDPNDDPENPIPNDTRKVTLPTDAPGSPKRSHHKRKSETVN